MTAETIHTCSYYCERPECVRRQRDELRDRMESALAQQPAAPSNARGEAEYEYEVWQGAVLQAGGRENDYASAQSEANHYAAMYAQDGPVEVRIYEKRLLSADKVQPKRRRYDPYGSLSEYGIFPECDAQPPAEEGERDWLAPAMDEMAEWRMDALEAARADGWQPIETAPKDGTRVLLWYEWHDLPVVGDFRHDRWWSVHSLGGNLVYNKDEVRMPIATARPAYWRPLPAPPAIESAREERDALAHGGEE